MKISTIFLCLLFTMSLAFARTSLLADDAPIVEKKLSATQTLVIRRQEIPYKGPSEEEIKESNEFFKTRDPNVDLDKIVFAKPDHFYEYTFMLEEANHPGGKNLGKNLFNSYATGVIVSRGYVDHSKWEFYDTIMLEGERLLVIYNAGGRLIAHRMAQDDKGVEDVIFMSGYQDGPIVKSAKINGTLKDKLLSVTVEFTEGSAAKWLLKDGKWVEEKNDQPKK